MKLKLLDEKGTLTYWEIGVIIRAFDDAFKEIPLALHSRVTEEEKWATEHLVNSLTAMNNRIVEYDAQWSALEQKAVEETDGYWRKVEKAHRDLNERIKRLPKIEDIALPTYQMEKALELADKCSHYTDEQWARVIELAKALGRQVEKE